MEKHSCRTYFALHLNELVTDEHVASILGVTPNRENGHYVIGHNEAFDIDVNNMLRITLRCLFGKEETIKQLCELCAGRAYLEIVPHIVHDSEEPSQILSLDADIIEFLYKSGTILDLDYYVV